MSRYYSLIAGLPEIRSEEYKLQYNLLEFKEMLRDNLDGKDFGLVMLLYRKFDNLNLLAFLKYKDHKPDPRGSISNELFDELIKQIKEQENVKDKRFPDYFRTFIPAFLSQTPLFPGLSWEDQLNSLYFDDAIQCGNSFISAWFEFNLNITNILTAIISRKYSIEPSGTIVGGGELAGTISSNNAKDFGIAPIFPYLDEVMRIADEPNLLDREKKMDLLKWNWIEENVFHYHFSVENIFAYLLQTEIIERWINLNSETGALVFQQIIGQLQGSFEFPDEYKLIK